MKDKIMLASYELLFQAFGLVILSLLFSLLDFYKSLAETIYLGRLKSKPLIPINDTEEFQKADDESAIVVTRLGS